MSESLPYEVGDQVYCFACGLDGTITRLDCLGLSFAPVIQTTDGKLRMFCGQGIRDFCGQVDAFTAQMRTRGATDEDVAAFREAWRVNADPWTQRPTYYAGLLAVQATNDDAAIDAYIQTIKQNIGL